MMYSTIDWPQTITAIGVVITALTGLVTALGIRWNTVITKQAGKAAENAVKGAEEAVKTSQVQMTAIHKKMDGSQLRNGSLLAVLKWNALNARRLAMLPGASEDDLNAAADAERLLAEQLVKEAKAEREREQAAAGMPQI